MFASYVDGPFNRGLRTIMNKFNDEFHVIGDLTRQRLKLSNLKQASLYLILNLTVALLGASHAKHNPSPLAKFLA